MIHLFKTWAIYGSSTTDTKKSYCKCRVLVLFLKYNKCHLSYINLYRLKTNEHVLLTRTKALKDIAYTAQASGRLS